MINQLMVSSAGTKRNSGVAVRSSLPFYLFISPWLLGFLGLTLLPMLFSLYASFTDWDGIILPTFVGLDNFKRMFLEDDRFLISIKNTLYYAFASVPLSLGFALVIAVLLRRNSLGSRFFRSVFYLPSVIAGVATFLVWGWMYEANSGIFNYFLSLVGIQGPDWLLDPKWAMPSIIIMSLSFCGGAILIFLAGLQNVPEQYYEAAKLDGATQLQQFKFITLPSITPVILFNLIMGVIDSFQVFAQPWIMTGGGPVDATYVYGLHIYNAAFRYYEFGYASALAWVLFIVILIPSLLILLSSKKWVHYEGR
jgi:multiple sugar transport system permease protein